MLEPKAAERDAAQFRATVKAILETVGGRKGVETHGSLAPYQAGEQRSEWLLDRGSRVREDLAAGGVNGREPRWARALMATGNAWCRWPIDERFEFEARRVGVRSGA